MSQSFHGTYQTSIIRRQLNTNKLNGVSTIDFHIAGQEGKPIVEEN